MQLVANIYHCIAPYAIESDWDDICAPRLAGFPLKCFTQSGSRCATYVFDRSTFVAGEQSRQMCYRPTVDFSGCDPYRRKNGNIQIPRIRATLRGVRARLQDRNDSHDCMRSTAYMGLPDRLGWASADRAATCDLRPGTPQNLYPKAFIFW